MAETTEDSATAAIDGVPVELPARIVVGDHPQRLTIRISVKGVLEGQVLDDKGFGLPGITVEIHEGADGDYVRYGTTGSDGWFRYAVRQLPATVVPKSRDGRFRFDPPRRTMVEQDGGSLLFVGQPDDRPRLYGRVVEQASTVAVGGARVSVLAHCTEEEDLDLEAFTDKDGRFDLPCLEQCGLAIRLWPPTGSELLEKRIDGRSYNCSEELLLELDAGSMISGTVRDKNGKRIGKLPLVLGSGVKYKTATDDEGRYRFEGVGPGKRKIAVDHRRASPAQRLLVVTREAKKRDDNGLELPTVSVKEAGKSHELDLVARKGGNVCVTVAAKQAVTLDEFKLFVDTAEEPVDRQRSSGALRRDDPARLCSSVLPPGTYQVLAGHPKGSFVMAWWPGVTQRDLAGFVELSGNGTVELRPLLVTPAGRITAIAEGFPSEDQDSAIVSLRAHALKGEERVDESSWTKVPAENIEFTGERFVVWGVPIGAWDVQLCRTQCDGPDVWSSDDVVVVEAGKVASAALVQPQASMQPEVNQKGKVTASRRKHKQLHLAAVPAGTWNLRFSLDDDTCQSPPAWQMFEPVTVVPGQTATIVLKPPPQTTSGR